MSFALTTSLLLLICLNLSLAKHVKPCPLNEVWACKNCEKNCNDVLTKLGKYCIPVCFPGCRCKKGYVRSYVIGNKKGPCIPAKLCPRTTHCATCPSSCGLWFDGCNWCKCSSFGRPVRCTRRRSCACRLRGLCKSKCIAKRLCPRNCKKWFDGCNVCECKHGKALSCTHRACYRHGIPRCLQTFAKPKRPKWCTKWFDGCNVCEYKNGVAIRCTKRACKFPYPQPSYCKFPVRRCPLKCKVWFNGCKECSCEHGHILSCNKRKCKKPKLPKCKIFHPPLDPVCSLPKCYGTCRGSFKRYWYNQATGKCEVFWYGGCNGNANNFRTLQQCVLRCV